MKEVDWSLKGAIYYRFDDDLVDWTYDSNDPNNWNSAICVDNLSFISTIGGITPKQFEFLFSLIKNGKGIFKPEYRCNYSFLENKELIVGNVRHNAARIIQNAWKDALVNINTQVGINRVNRDYDQTFGLL